MTQIIIYDNKSVHIDGYKSIITFDSERLCISCKNRILEIKGKGLQIDSFTEVCMNISGYICDISWVN